LLKQILKFIDHAKELCENLSDEDFMKGVNALLSNRRQPEINLTAVKYRMHGEILTHKYKFDRIQAEIEILEDMIKDNESILNAKIALRQHFYDIFTVSCVILMRIGKCKDTHTGNDIPK